MTESLVIPLWPFFIVFLTGMAFMAVSFLFQTYSGILVLLGKDQDWPTFDDDDGGQPIL